jgi:hypothetical protein
MLGMSVSGGVFEEGQLDKALKQNPPAPLDLTRNNSTYETRVIKINLRSFLDRPSKLYAETRRKPP